MPAGMPTPLTPMFPPGGFRIPTAAKTFVDSVLLRRKAPVTEKNFTPEELKAMQQLTSTAPATNRTGKRGVVDYNSYWSMGDAGNIPAGLDSMKTPVGNVKTTLGQFNYAHDTEGGTTITDTYDFNGGSWPSNLPFLDKVRQAMADPYHALRMTGGTLLNAEDGQGRPVKIALAPANPHR